MKKVLLYFLVFIAVQLGVTGCMLVMTKLWFPEVGSTSPTFLLIALAISSVITIALFLGFKWCPVSRNYVRTRPWATMIWSVLLGVGMIIPLTWIEEQVPETWRTNLLGEEFTKMMQTTEGYFLVCMVTPLMEEIVFRGAMVRALLSWFDGRMPETKVRWAAIVSSALIFSVAHFNPAQIPHAFIAGMLMSWMFVKFGSIVPGLLVHWVNNSMAYVMVNLYPWLPMDAKLADYFGGNSMAVTQAVLCSLLIAVPSLYQLVRVKSS